jgi:DNA-binding NtrC family response regulator
MRQAKILLLDFDPAGGLSAELRQILESSPTLDLQFAQVPVQAFTTDECDRELSGNVSRLNPDVAFLVLARGLLNETGALFKSMRTYLTKWPMIVVMEAGGPDQIFEWLKLGAADFITPPFKAVDILPRVWRLLEQTRQGDELPRTLKERFGLKQFIGESPAFLAEIKKIPLMAKCDASILILGETGTGKELCARSIHYLSSRSGKPFIPVNCGAIPTELVENELFGHERGAFTGASTSQLGVIHEANSGTLFLDEIDCLPLLAQVKILRFLQEKEYRSLGAARPCKADVRVIAATNIDIEAAVRDGKIRQDLYYRLNVIPLVLPPLRERPEDIPLLARHFLAKYATEFDKPLSDCSSEAMQVLVQYEWPGNVRELEHVIERAVVLSEQIIIRQADIILPRLSTSAPPGSFQDEKAKVVAQFERAYIQGLLLAYQGNITKAAQAAQKNRRAFWQLMRKHRINVQSFKAP